MTGHENIRIKNASVQRQVAHHESDSEATGSGSDNALRLLGRRRNSARLRVGTRIRSPQEGHVVAVAARR